MSIIVTLKLLPLGFYGVFINMDLLASHRTKVDCYDKLLECLCNEGKEIVLQVIKKHVFIQ